MTSDRRRLISDYETISEGQPGRQSSDETDLVLVGVGFWLYLSADKR